MIATRNQKVPEIYDMKMDAKLCKDLHVFTQSDMKEKLVLNKYFRSEKFAVFTVIKGSFKFQNNYVSHVLKERDVFFVLPNSVFMFEHMSEDLSLIALSFKKEYLKGQGIHLSSNEIMYMLSSEVQRKFTLNDEEFPEIIFNLNTLRKKLNLAPETPHLSEIIRSSFLVVFYGIFLLCDKHRTQMHIQLNRPEELTTKFLTMLAENFRKERMVKYYSDQLFITSRHLSQVIKKVTGKTAGEIIDKMVVQEAKMLVLSRMYSIAQIAELLHFSNQSFFGKYFKKHVGVSPSSFKLETHTTHTPF